MYILHLALKTESAYMVSVENNLNTYIAVVLLTKLVKWCTQTIQVQSISIHVYNMYTIGVFLNTSNVIHCSCMLSVTTE